MNYKKIYFDITERGKTRSRIGYTERHHILPKCMGGTNEKSNIVRLTAKEHYIVHLLLCKIYPNNKSLIYAMWRLTNSKGKQGYKISAKTYETIKKDIAKFLSESKSGQSQSAETIKKRSNALIGRIRSDEERKSISDGRKGMKFTEEHRTNISKCQIGRKLSEETKAKMSAAHKLRQLKIKEKNAVS